MALQLLAYVAIIVPLFQLILPQLNFKENGTVPSIVSCSQGWNLSRACVYCVYHLHMWVWVQCVFAVHVCVCHVDMT